MTNSLGLCLIVKDEEEDYLREWVEYHRRLGVEVFIIYDNESQVSVKETLADYIGQGLACVLETHGKFMQDMVYTHCLHFFGGMTKWLGFLDADEFLVPHTSDDLADFLVPYEAYGGLAVNWVLFGSAGHERKPNGGQVEAFIKCVQTPPGTPTLVKCIVQPRRVINLLTPHAFAFFSGYSCVGEDFDLVQDAFRPFSTDKIQINHYVLRSHDQFAKKIERGRADHGQSPYHRQAYFDEIDRQCTVEDRRAIELYRRREDTPLPSKKPSFPEYVQKPDSFLPSQVDFLRYSAAVKQAKEQNDDVSIEAIYRLALQKYPDIHQTKMHLADWLEEHGRVEEAGELLEKAFQVDPQGIEFRKKLGLNQSKRGLYAQAESNLRFALEADPQNYDLLAALGNLYLKTRRLKDALFCFDAILSNQPWHKGAWEGILAVMKEAGA